MRGLKEQAEQELLTEGLDPQDADYVLELDMLYGGLIQPKRTATPGLFLRNEEDVWAFYQRFEQEFSEAFSPLIVNLPGGVYIETFILKAIVPSHKVELVARELHRPRRGSCPKREPFRLLAWDKGVDRDASLQSRQVTPWERDCWSGDSGIRVYHGRHTAADDVSSRCLWPGYYEGGKRIISPVTLSRPALQVQTRCNKKEKKSMPIPTAEEKLKWIKIVPPTQEELDAVAKLLPGDYEIGFQRTNDILDEALEVFQRSCRSSMGIAGDVMVAIFTAQGDLVNGAAGTYLHAIIQPILIKYILTYYSQNPGIHEGDVWVANDALYGGIHNPDIVAIVPGILQRAS